MLNSRLSTEVRARVARLLRLDDVTQVEELQVTRYRQDEYYFKHQDFFVHWGDDEVKKWRKWAKAAGATKPEATSQIINELLRAEDVFSVNHQHFSKGDRGRFNAAHLEHMVYIGPSLGERARRVWEEATGAPYRPPPENRLATVLIYLTEDFEGGHTAFTDTQPNGAGATDERGSRACDPRNEAVRVIPRPGDALLFYNLRDDNLPDARSMHAGCPVTAGVKFVITAWVWLPGGRKWR
jgi:hypothetical protein